MKVPAALVEELSQLDFASARHEYITERSWALLKNTKLPGNLLWTQRGNNSGYVYVPYTRKAAKGISRWTHPQIKSPRRFHGRDCWGCMSLSLVLSRSMVCSLQLPWPHHVSPTLFPLVSPILSRHSESGAPGVHTLCTLIRPPCLLQLSTWRRMPHCTFFCVPSSVFLLRFITTLGSSQRVCTIPFFSKVRVRTTRQPISGNFMINFMNTLLNAEWLRLRLKYMFYKMYVVMIVKYRQKMGR